ncbi:Lrp/AsnC family transcriptional regulator [Flavobacteriaceae bacterium S356]|uniref:Lrp/AsnC family transcriptional regulator n=1 Tax=Asprobacillus argus TaxID=3076534 RepID=A0ABU3LFH7_9FLAO|nr:Lrp/AsnC family transcriptional regulator [Flavobacteriaceae bacterium S356]
MQLDQIDKKIVGILQTNSNQTNKQIALQLNLSVTATYERIKKLEKEGVIKKYVALIDHDKVNRSFTAFCHIKLAQHTKEYISTFEKEIMQLEEVSECFHVSGDYDYILKVYVEDMKAYREFMVNKLTVLRHIGSTHSIFTINAVKNSSSIAL